jgi:hypothetical protein
MSGLVVLWVLDQFFIVFRVLDQFIQFLGGLRSDFF